MRPPPNLPQRCPTKADSSLTTPEPTPESYCSPGPLVRSGALSLRMTADQAGGFGDHKEMGRDEATPEPTPAAPDKSRFVAHHPRTYPRELLLSGAPGTFGGPFAQNDSGSGGRIRGSQRDGADETTPEPTPEAPDKKQILRSPPPNLPQRRPTKADSSLTTPEPTPESYC